MPLTCWSETLEIDETSAVHNDMANLDYASKPNQAFLVDLILAEQVSVIVEIAQEPVQLPESPSSAVNAAGNGSRSEMLGFEDNKPEDVVRLLGMPAILGASHSDQIQTVWK